MHWTLFTSFCLSLSNIIVTPFIPYLFVLFRDVTAESKFGEASRLSTVLLWMGPAATAKHMGQLKKNQYQFTCAIFRVFSSVYLAYRQHFPLALLLELPYSYATTLPDPTAWYSAWYALEYRSSPVGVVWWLSVGAYTLFLPLSPCHRLFQPCCYLWKWKWKSNRESRQQWEEGGTKRSEELRRNAEWVVCFYKWHLSRYM